MRKFLFVGFLSAALAACGLIFSDHKVSAPKISPRTIIKSQGCIGPPPECLGGGENGGGEDEGE